ncbi:MAG: MaoC family dehydratase [Betaproteobacteria bacterium]|nr:MaoC family dehydratase [Betaproteobacteria bacterium]
MSFYAYSRIAENRYRERFGLDFEDFSPGQHFLHRPGVTITQQDNLDEALDTLNAAMLHYDANYAARTTWKKPLMVSTITLQRLIGMSSKTFGRKREILGFKEIAMTAPVFGGDTLYAESEILLATPGTDTGTGEVTVLCRGVNQEGREVARVTYRVAVWKRGQHPEDRAAPGARLAEPRFASHRQTEDGAWMEAVGLFFEDCRADETFVHWPRRTLLRDEGMEHAWRSLELAPQYHDLDWISRHAEGNFRFSETWIVTIATAMTTRTFGRVVANLGWTDIEFHGKVAPGDTMESESTILDKRESKSRPNEGILSVETRATNQRGEAVLSYKRNLLVYKRAAETPYAAAGY